MHTPRILLIDDDEGMRLAIRRTLERDGYVVLESNNGKEGLQQLERGPVDLVITDMIMPDHEGLEVTLTLHKTHPQIPVIAISGGGHLAPEFHLKLARSAGATRVLAKPFAMKDLLGQVKSLTTPLG